MEEKIMSNWTELLKDSKEEQQKINQTLTKKVEILDEKPINIIEILNEVKKDE